MSTASPLVVWSAGIDALLFAAIGLLHVYWSLGGTWGADVALPTRGGRPSDPPKFTFHPTPLGTFIVALLLFAAAVVVLGQVGVIGDPTQPPHTVFLAGTWVLAALFLLRAIGEFRYVGFFKRVRDTEFAKWDTQLFSPLCLGIAVLAAIAALGG